MTAFDNAMLRLGAVGQVMNSIRATENFLAHVRLHVRTLRCIFRDKFFIRELKGNGDKTAHITTAIIDLGLPSDVETDLLNNLLDEVNADGQKIRNQQLQDYVSLPNYPSQAMWGCLGEDGLRAAKAYRFIAFLISIGLWCPSETTFQMLTCAFLAACHGELVVETMDADMKRAELNYMKRAFRDQIKVVGDDTPVFVPILPEDPEQFIRDYPSLATPLLKDPPGGAPLELKRLKVMASQIKMRKKREPAPAPGRELMPTAPQGMHWGGVLICSGVGYGGGDSIS
jgi:hypothetical protein